MKILIINASQFGYTAGYYYYCKYLSEQGHKIDYYCLDEKLPRIGLLHVRVRYLTLNKSYFNWRLQFYKFISGIRFSRYDVIFIKHHRFAFIYRLLGVPSRAIIDIRTGDLSPGNLSRYFWNSFIKFDTLLYNHITILSESLRTELRLAPGKCTLLPLGADIISDSSKEYYPLSFLYVGTFTKRNIQQTVEGVMLFAEKYPHVPLRYDIIGFGSELEEHLVNQAIEKSNHNGRIKFHGRKNYTELKSFFTAANIGFSYIPMTPFFDCQPATKTFDYILSGIVCIATRTSENKKIISPVNGMLCDDNPQSLCSAIEEFYLNRDKFNYLDVKNSLLEYQWKNIVTKKIEPLFLSMAAGSTA